MARRPSVFVRDLTPEEARRIRDLSRKGKTFAQRQRAQIVLASASRMSARQIADVVQTDENQVRRVVHDFNEAGMDSLHPRSGGGRPRKIDEPTRDRIVAIALARPQDLGEAETHWSLRRLRRYLIRTRVVKTISREQLRRILRHAGITYQRTRTWKWSPDPLYEPKKNWVLALYAAAEAGTLTNAAVVCFDNLSTHWTPEIRRWAADPANNVALMATPTYASHLNRVECQLWGFVEFVIRCSDYPDWATFERMAKAYIRRRNRDHHDPRIREVEYRRRVA